MNILLEIQLKHRIFTHCTECLSMTSSALLQYSYSTSSSCIVKVSGCQATCLFQCNVCSPLESLCQKRPVACGLLVITLSLSLTESHKQTLTVPHREAGHLFRSIFLLTQTTLVLYKKSLFFFSIVIVAMT